MTARLSQWLGGRESLYRAEGPAGKSVARQIAETGRAVVREIRFATKSAQILSGSEAVLTQIARLLNDDPKLELVIEGHTDNVGGAEFNLDLSRRRADAVKRWLADKGGISEVRPATVGYGLTRPVADNGTEEGGLTTGGLKLLRK